MRVGFIQSTEGLNRKELTSLEGEGSLPADYLETQTAALSRLSSSLGAYYCKPLKINGKGRGR